MIEPKLSLVIPFHNETIRQTLLSLLRCQDISLCEVILVSDGPLILSLDEFRSLDMRVVIAERSGRIGFLRNRGIEVARSESLYFVDSDCELREDAIVRMLQHDGKLVVKGRNIFDGQNWASKLDAQIRDERYSRQPTFAYCPNLLVKREVFSVIGKFDEERTYGSDGEFAKRIKERGIPVHYNQECVLYHDVTNTATGIFRKWMQMGEARYYRYKGQHVTDWFLTYFPDLYNSNRGITYNATVACCNVGRGFGMLRAWIRSLRGWPKCES